MSMSKYASKEDFENRSLADRLSDEADQCRNDGADDIANLLDEARGELERLRKDAGRYQHIRSNAVWRPTIGSDRMLTWDLRMPTPDISDKGLAGDSVRLGLDAAIDAAMGKKP